MAWHGMAWHGKGGYLKQLDICVEKITLCDMYALEAQLMNQLQNTSGDDGLPTSAGAGKGPL